MIDFIAFCDVIGREQPVCKLVLTVAKFRCLGPLVRSVKKQFLQMFGDDLCHRDPNTSDKTSFPGKRELIGGERSK